MENTTEVILKKRTDRLEAVLMSLLTDFVLNEKTPESVELAGADALTILSRPLGLLQYGYSPRPGVWVNSIYGCQFKE